MTSLRRLGRDERKDNHDEVTVRDKNPGAGCLSKRVGLIGRRLVIVIKSAYQYPVHALLSYEGNLMYKVPPYQREYSR